MKKIKTLIIVLVSILIVGIITILALYFATDIFKSNKKMFNNYLAKLELNTFIETEDLVKFEDRIKEEPYTSEGNLLIKMEAEEGYDVSINEEFEYTTQNDPNKKISSAKINYKQDGENKLTVNYLRNKDLYGLQFQDIVNQYIVIENNNLKEFAQKLGIEDLDKIPNQIDEKSIEEIANIEEIPNIGELTEQIKQIGKKYANTFISQIPDKNYTKIKKEQIVVDGKTINSDGYKVRLTGEELSNILSTIVEIAKQDNDIYNLVSKLINDENFDLETYQNLIEYYSEIDTESIEYLDISLYKQENKLVKTYINIEMKEEDSRAYPDVIGYDIPEAEEIKTNIGISIENNKSIVINYKQNENDINISIVKSENDGSYEIKVASTQDNEEVLNMVLMLSRTGNINEQSIETSASLDISIKDMANIKLQSNNTVNFGLDENIEEFTEGNYGIINNFSEEQLGNLAINLGENISQKINFENTIIGKGLSIYLNAGLFEKARVASSETKIAQIREAMALAKADILADYYDPNSEKYLSETAPSTEEIKQKINEYLDTTSLAVKEPTEPIVNEEGTTWIIEIDQDIVQDSSLVLDSSNNKFTINVWKSE